jgi:LCP family protein required for cell wall assembly
VSPGSGTVTPLKGVKGPSHARSLRSHAVARSIALALTAVVAFVGVGGATAAVRLTGNIDGVDTDGLLAEEDRPEVVVPEDPNAGTALNIVLMGSDDRSGENQTLVGDDTDGMRSDTTMVMHISADRSRVELVSIPRDSTVDIPSCPTTNGKRTEPISNSKFNGAFAQGVMTGGDVGSGALCAQYAIESLTDVRMDGFIVIDFAGFQKMIDALGGVEICIPEDVYSPKANHLKLDAGVQTLNGTLALQYARARTGDGLGNGSDLNRIGRQQELMAALARTVLSKNLLTDSPALLQFLGAVTSSLTMSDKFSSIPGLAGLAYSVRNVRPDTITFMTVPYATDPSDANNVVWTDDADVVWENLKYDRPVTSDPAAATPPPSGAPADGATEPSAPAEGGAPAEGEADAPAETAAPTPSPGATKEAGKEAFTGADVTSVCG